MSDERVESTEAENEEIQTSGDLESSENASAEEVLKVKEEEIKGYIDRIQRLQADFENYKKRIAREHESLSRGTENRVYLKVLPIYDNFERAIVSYRESGDKNGLAEGVMQIFAQFEDLLASEEIVPIEAVGKSFDHNKHEALLSVESDEPPNTILEEFERGYQRGKEVLRPSRVKVSRKPAQSDSGTTETANKDIDNANGKGES